MGYGYGIEKGTRKRNRRSASYDTMIRKRWIGRPTFLEVLDITAGERDTNLVNFGGDGSTGRIVILFSLSDVATHVDLRVARR
jgi:hypothetical protein